MCRPSLRHIYYPWACESRSSTAALMICQIGSTRIAHVQLYPRFCSDVKIAGEPSMVVTCFLPRATLGPHPSGSPFFQMHSTGPAERHPAAKFCSCQSERVSEDPQQWSRWINVHLDGLPFTRNWSCNFLRANGKPSFPWRRKQSKVTTERRLSCTNF